jgi:hypothetical protein
MLAAIERLDKSTDISTDTAPMAKLPVQAMVLQ